MTISLHGIEMTDDGAGRLAVTLPPRYEVEPLGEFLDALSAYLHARAGQPFWMLVDVSQVEQTSNVTRRRFADFFASEDELIRRDCRAAAIVVASAMQQGAITAVLWLRPLGAETKVFRDRGEAERWLAQP